MSTIVATPPKKAAPSRLTLHSLHQELHALRERVADLEDLRELNEAIARNQGRRLIPWATAKRELGLNE